MMKNILWLSYISSTAYLKEKMETAGLTSNFAAKLGQPVSFLSL